MLAPRPSARQTPPLVDMWAPNFIRPRRPRQLAIRKSSLGPCFSHRRGQSQRLSSPTDCVNLASVKLALSLRYSACSFPSVPRYLNTVIPAPLPPDETARLAALRDYDILDTPAEAAFDDLTRLAAQICRTPITLVDEHRQWFKARIGLEIAETPREFSFCAHTILGADLLVVPDLLADARF